MSAASEVLATVTVIDAVLTTSRWASTGASGGGGGPNAGAGAVTPSFMASVGMAVIAPPLSGAVFGRAPEQAVSMPNTAIPASASVNQPRLDLPEIRFMIINLAIGCENRQRRSKGP